MKRDLAAFRLLSPVAQIEQIRGTRAERVFQVDRQGIDEKKRTAWLAIASSAPYERWWGVEVLEVSPEAINDERLRAGAPLLVNHRVEDHVGVIEDFAIARGKLRVLARFGRSARAEEVWQDVLDGIRLSTSVGYVINDLVLEKQEDGINHYRVTSWTPLEGSLASVPADISVGVGRSRTNTNEREPMEQHQEQDTRRQRVEARAQEKNGGEAQRILDLTAAGREFADMGGMEVAQRLIANGGNLDMFRGAMLERISSKPHQREFGGPGGGDTFAQGAWAESHGTGYGEGARQIIRMPKHFGEGEAAKERAYRAGMWLRGLIGRAVPSFRSERIERYLAEAGLARSMAEGSDPDGGYLVPTELSMAIIDLRERYGAFRQNSDIVPMSSDAKTMPKSTSDPEAEFVDENGALPEDKGQWGVVNFLAKKIGVVTRISSELEEDAIIDVADRAALQIARAFVKKEDQCGFLGDGTSTYGGMTGIFPTLEDGNHAGGVVAVTGSHDTFPEIDATDLGRVMAALPQFAHEGAKWYCSPDAWTLVFWRLMAAASGNAIRDLAAPVQKFYAGYPVVMSPVLPKGATTDYSGKCMLAFGDLRLSSKFGSRRDIRIRILQERYAEYDQIGVKATQRFHIVNHDLGDDTTAGPMVGLIGGAS